MAICPYSTQASLCGPVTNKNHRERNPFIKSRRKFVRPNNIAMIKRENFLPPLKNLDSLDTLLLILIRIHFL